MLRSASAHSIFNTQKLDSCDEAEEADKYDGSLSSIKCDCQNVEPDPVTVADLLQFLCVKPRYVNVTKLFD